MWALVLFIAALCAAAVNAFFVFNTVRNLRAVPKLPELNVSDGASPLVSVLIPACNEADKIKKCLLSITKQDYANFEVIVLDDASTDATYAAASNVNSNIVVIKGLPHPKGWVGKTYACNQLADAAKGELLLFLDADCYFTSSRAMTSMVANMYQQHLAMLSLIPKDDNKKLWQQIVMPITNTFLLSLRIDKLLLGKGANQKKPEPNMCTLVTKKAYGLCGGYCAVKDSAIEGVDFATNVARIGEYGLFTGVSQVSVYHYDATKQFINGNTRRLFASINYSSRMLMAIIVGSFLAFYLPFLLLAATESFPVTALLLFAITCMYVTRILTSIRMRESYWPIVLHPIALLVHLVILVYGAWSYTFRPVAWKQRKLPRRSL